MGWEVTFNSLIIVRVRVEVVVRGCDRWGQLRRGAEGAGVALGSLDSRVVAHSARLGLPLSLRD